MKGGGWAALAAAAAAIAVVTYATRPAVKPSLGAVISEEGYPILDLDGNAVLADELGNLFADTPDGPLPLGDSEGLGLSIFKRVVNEVKREGKQAAKVAVAPVKFAILTHKKPIDWLKDKKHRQIAAGAAAVAGLTVATILTMGATSPLLVAAAPALLSVMVPTGLSIAVSTAGKVGAAVADHNHQLTQEQADEAAAAQAQSPAPADTEPAPARSWWDDLFS